MRLYIIAVLMLVCISCDEQETNIMEYNSIKNNRRYVSFPWPWMCGYRLVWKNAFTEDDILKMVEQIKDIVEIEPDVSLYKDCLYPWSEIYKYMTTFDDWVIGETRIKCDKCYESTLLIYYMTPDETWASLRGRGGYFLACPHCLKQIDFFTLIMN